ncbi:MAG: AraC family L-rhamnose operon regulatory protein RhaS [Lentisphaeria bacterium]|jgi:AraC family L-rhamnose operon regulatory protein RhaS
MSYFTYLLKDHLKYPELPLSIQRGFHDKAFHTHNHDFGELVVVVAGTAVHTVKSKRYLIREGDVFVINGPLAHGFSEAHELNLYNIMYDYNRPIFDKPSLRALAGYQNLFTLGPTLRGKENFISWANLQGEDSLLTKRLVASMFLEYETGREGFREMLLAQLHQLIIHLSRCNELADSRDQQRLLPLARAIAYMEDNYQTTEILLGDIAFSACIGARQLERLFSRYLGRPPIHYLKELRLKRAEEILRYQPEKRIAEIAFRCGFSDANYFTRAFKKLFGCSPTEYRKGMLSES